MKAISILFAALFLVGVTWKAGGQSPTLKPDTIKPPSELRLGMWYTSDSYYFGRADSIAAPYLSPSLSYFHKSGIFLGASFSYLTAAEQSRVDLYGVTAGYNYSTTKWAAGVMLTRNFFDEQSYVTQSPINTCLIGYVGHDFDWILLYLDGGLSFSQYTDQFLGLSIERTFRMPGNRFLITPIAYAKAGTQQYYEEHLNQQRGKGGAKRGSGHAGSGQLSESTDFKLLDVEFELDVTYSLGRVKCSLSGTYVIPVNAATFVESNGNIIKEQLIHGFYWRGGVRIQF